jgi:predicted nucleotidyltransferase component of viral defense system
MNIFVEKLKNIVREKRNEGVSDIVTINSLKEEIQYAVLDFIYNSKEYSHLIMYGGTLLRIVYNLPRMSEDLDFQTDKKINFAVFTKDITEHFKRNYDFNITVKENTGRPEHDSAYINFSDVLKEVGIKGDGLPTVLKLRFDVNYFSEVSKFTNEMVPKTKDTFSFSIKTYPVSTLMASKIAAVLLRGKRGVGSGISDCKPRDIYDLMWYMDKKILPNFDYIKAIHARVNNDMKAENILDIFDALSRKIMNLDDKLFRDDLAQFFYNQAEYDAWHRNWKERFRILREFYREFKIKKVNDEPVLIKEGIELNADYNNKYFKFYLHVDNSNEIVVFTFILERIWSLMGAFKDKEEYSNGAIESGITSSYVSSESITKLDHQYAVLFYKKILDYLKRNDYTVYQQEFQTKIIRATAENLNIKTQLFLDRRLLEKEKLEDLL